MTLKAAERRLPGKRGRRLGALDYERSVANNYVVRFETRRFQSLKAKSPLPRPKDKVTVRIGIDGSMAMLWKETKLLVKELTNTQDHKPKKAA